MQLVFNKPEAKPRMRKPKIPVKQDSVVSKNGTRVQNSSSVKKKESPISNQISGFTRCLQIWFDREFKHSPNHSFICRTLTTLLKDVPLGKLPKAFKGMLAYNFSRFTGQELPEVDFEFSKKTIWTLFAPKDARRIRARLTCGNRKNRRLITLWSLLQCKVLANKVPEEFSHDALLKHRETVGKEPEALSPAVLQDIRDFVRPFVAKTVEEFLKREGKTQIPNKHSCIESKRKFGGNFGYYKENNCFSSGLYRTNRREDRFDPSVIHLEGIAGRGKSTMTKLICRKIEEKFGIRSLPSEGMGREVYSRSAGTDHWDGYRQQLIAVVDDFSYEGCQIPSQSIGSTTLSEIIQMCSDVDYVLPMADLKEKGMKFTSKFLILTSNRASDNCQAMQSGMDPLAFCRRISPTYRINKDRTFDKYVADPYFTNLNSHLSSTRVDGVSWVLVERNLTVDDIVTDALAVYDQRYSFFQKQFRPEHSFTWVQPISKDLGGLFSLRCKNEPPKRIPYVSASVVQDPLKARIITIPSGDAYCLKPVQKSMFSALSHWKCFEPCHFPEYDLSYLGELGEDEYFLTGDYSAATDGLNFHASQVVIDELAIAFERIDPRFSHWIRHEGGKHLVVYPRKSGIPDVIQQNGQLMGSLLSFPILSILNAYTLCRATGTSLDKVRGLFHGDDISAIVNKAEFTRWGEFAKLIGFELSLGKNYLSRDFVAMDSQIFLKQGNQFVKQHSGKLKLVYRTSGSVPTCRRALEEGFTLDQIRRYAPDVLRETVKSLRVPEEYGGLGRDFADGPVTLHEKLVYLAEVSLKCQVSEMIPGVFTMEKSLADFLHLRNVTVASLQEPSEDNHDRKLRMRVVRLHRRLRKSADFYQYVKTLDLSLQRPLSSICPVIVRCDDHSKESLTILQSSILGNKICPRPSLKRLQMRDVPSESFHTVSCKGNDMRFAGKLIGPASRGTPLSKPKRNFGKFLKARALDACQMIFG